MKCVAYIKKIQIMTVFSFISALFTAPLDIYYYTKWIITYIAIRIISLCRYKRFDLYDINAKGDPVKLGFIVPEFEKEFESPYPESHLKTSSDEIFIYGVNSKNECLLTRIARGPNQTADAWIYLKLANGKTYHLPENTGLQQPFDGKCLIFSCGKLQMHYLLPMRRWRIFYCGMLRETSETKKDSGEMVFVKFIFQWTASSNVYDPTLDTNMRGFSSAISRAKWKVPFLPPVVQFSDALSFYAQGGVTFGTVTVNEESDYEMYLFGEKLRITGKSSNIRGCKFTNILGHTPSNGFNFHLGKASVPSVFNNLPYGFVVQPFGGLEAVQDVDYTITSSSTGQQRFKATFTTNDTYEVDGCIKSDPIILYSGQGWSGFLELSFVEFKIGTKKGSGLILSGEVYKKPQVFSTPTPIPPSFPKLVPLTVTFTNDVSEFGEISGGKGSSLGKLTRLSKELKNFTVPKGIVITTSAYGEFTTPDILAEVKNLEDVVYGNVAGEVKNACKLMADVIVRATLPHKICQSVIQHLKEIFGDEVNGVKFAVRSSATGEDTAQMSAAGQMDTFLGVQGIAEVLNAVKKCWASQFGLVAVEYKRRNGQLLNCPMAVVVQEMVSCDISGVLFTCDPVTSNPSKIAITANYGLGETVVSGAVEPDTIIMKRDDSGNLTVDSVEVGTKLQKMVMQESGGTSTEDVAEEFKSTCCLSEEASKQLGKLAIKIEDFYRSSRDIEWGIKDGRIYILQSRPVTNIASETDFEIEHELDAPMRCEDEYVSTANVGEVLPGATSHLGIDMTCKYFGNCMKQAAADKGQIDNFLSSKYFLDGMLSYYNHVMMTVHSLLVRYGLDSVETKGMMVSIFGRILDDPEMMDFIRNERKPPDAPPQSVKMRLRFYWDLFFCYIGNDKLKEQAFTQEPKFMKCNTARETFSAILNSCSDNDEVGKVHVQNSENSSNWNMYLFTALTGARKEIDNSTYSDFARLQVTSSDVESADIPKGMNDIAVQIVKDIGKEKFKALSVEEAERLLKTSKAVAGQKFRKFIKRHGHRCLKEFDVRTVTWGMDSKPLVKLLQNMVGNAESKKKAVESYDELFSELNTPLSLWTRCLLRFILPNCRKAIRMREFSKSVTVKIMDNWRQGFHRLSRQMVAEGWIPNADLLFFMVLDEINDLLKTRSPAIIARATHRRKLYPMMEGYHFPEIMKGMPKPMNNQQENFEFVADLTMKGTPVSHGIVKGFARVALSLEEAAHLKSGEILITISTDIGWSPYFPIVAGVVTEIGGLISHGAVVSREYGLPCIVGVHAATQKFRTGDYVLLDGKKGLLQRLPEPPISSSM